MHGSFLQRVILTMLAGLLAAGLVEAWKWTISANESINDPKNWQNRPSQAPP
jgi:hypothetical protein